MKKRNLRTRLTLIMLASTIMFSACMGSELEVSDYSSASPTAETTAVQTDSSTVTTTELATAEATTVETTVETTTATLQELASSETTSQEVTTVPTETEEITSSLTTTMATTVSTEASTSADITASEETSITTSEIVTTSVAEEESTEFVDSAGKFVLPVKNIQQLPELPAGCEITSTTIVMNYLGFDVDKMELMTYMPMMKSPDENGNWASPWDVFVGSPEYSYYGAYSPVIKTTVESYFEKNEIEGYEVVDLSDSLVIELIDYIDQGHPVLVWATIGMKRSRPGNSWTLSDGTPYTWIAGEHCLVLIGYDMMNNTLIFSDPYDKRGTVEYDFETFEQRYTELFMQALVIKRTDD